MALSDIRDKKSIVYLLYSLPILYELTTRIIGLSTDNYYITNIVIPFTNAVSLVLIKIIYLVCIITLYTIARNRATQNALKWFAGIYFIYAILSIILIFCSPSIITTYNAVTLSLLLGISYIIKYIAICFLFVVIIRKNIIDKSTKYAIYTYFIINYFILLCLNSQIEAHSLSSLIVYTIANTCNLVLVYKILFKSDIFNRIKNNTSVAKSI